MWRTFLKLCFTPPNDFGQGEVEVEGVYVWVVERRVKGYTEDSSLRLVYRHGIRDRFNGIGLFVREG